MFRKQFEILEPSYFFPENNIKMKAIGDQKTFLFDKAVMNASTYIGKHEFHLSFFLSYHMYIELHYHKISTLLSMLYNLIR